MQNLISLHTILQPCHYWPVGAIHSTPSQGRYEKTYSQSGITGKDSDHPVPTLMKALPVYAAPAVRICARKDVSHTTRITCIGEAESLLRWLGTPTKTHPLKKGAFSVLSQGKNSLPVGFF